MMTGFSSFNYMESIISFLGLFLQLQREVDLMRALGCINIQNDNLKTKNIESQKNPRWLAFNVQRLVIFSLYCYGFYRLPVI
jgi:hypothetical protein